MNFQEIVNLFIEGATSGVSAGSANLKIVGDKLIHFDTIIAERNENTFIVNMTGYSIQTGRLQKILKETIISDMLLMVYNVPMGYKKSLRDIKP